MPTLTTSRLALLPLSRDMISARLDGVAFDLVCELSDGPRSVHFPLSWPGDPLPMFGGLLAAMTGDEVEGTFVAVDVESAMTVGQLGTVGPIDDTGAQEIGYGVNREVWGRGFATEALGALLPYLLATPGVRCITAGVSVGNIASQRVIEKNGFVQAGTGWTKEDGHLILWRYPRPSGTASPPSSATA